MIKGLRVCIYKPGRRLNREGGRVPIPRLRYREVLARTFSPLNLPRSFPGALPQARIERAFSPPVLSSRLLDIRMPSSHANKLGRGTRSEMLDHAIEFFKMIPPRKQSQT